MRFVIGVVLALSVGIGAYLGSAQVADSAKTPPRKVTLRAGDVASFDHRDPRLNRLFVVAYASRGDHRPDSRLGLFVTTVRDGYQGGWRVLQVTTQPYD
jgi:hypothetical protein